MNITSNNYAGNVSETIVNFAFSAEKQEIKVENTGQTVLEFVINDNCYEIQPNKFHNYYGYFTSCTLRSKKGLGTYSFMSVDSTRIELDSVKADTTNLQTATTKLQTGISEDLTATPVWNSGSYWSYTIKAPVSEASSSYSNPIPVVAGEKYIISGSYNWMAKLYVITDSEGNTVGRHNSPDNAGGKANNVVFTIPYKGAFLRLYKYSGVDNAIKNTFVFKKFFDYPIKSTLAGKLIAFNGDSICRGVGNSFVGYPELIAINEGCQVENRAIGGGTLASGTGATRIVCTDITNMTSAADIICFEGGINDWSTNVPLGTLDTTSATRFTDAVDTTTFAGALDSIFRQAIARWPSKPKCFIIIHPAANYAFSNNTLSKTFTDYYSLIISACQKYSVPYIDLFKNSGLVGHIDAIKTAFTDNGSGTPDGLHPNEAGYKAFYVPQITDMLKKLVY